MKGYLAGRLYVGVINRVYWRRGFFTFLNLLCGRYSGVVLRFW